MKLDETLLKTQPNPKQYQTTKLPLYLKIHQLQTVFHEDFFRCQGLGHIPSECPNKKMITLAEYKGVDNSFIVDTTLEAGVDVEFVVEELVGPDEGACLVVQRALINTPDQGGNLQREAIFHTRCTIAQKVCTVIIDGGSCTNVAFQTLVSKLKSTT